MRFIYADHTVVIFDSIGQTRDFDSLNFGAAARGDLIVADISGGLIKNKRNIGISERSKPLDALNYETHKKYKIWYNNKQRPLGRCLFIKNGFIHP